jgi:hypothetical protein
MSTSGLPLCRTSSLRTSPVAWVGGAATRDRIGAFLPLEGAPYVIHPNSRAFALAACHALASNSWSSVSVQRLTFS